MQVTSHLSAICLNYGEKIYLEFILTFVAATDTISQHRIKIKIIITRHEKIYDDDDDCP